MKRVLAFFVLFCGIVNFSAQAQLRFGAVGGVNVSTMSIEENGVGFDPKSLVGFHVGGFMDISLTDRLSLQPAVLYSTKGSNYKGFDLTFKTTYIEVPVNFVYKLGWSDYYFLVIAGPYFGYGVGGYMSYGGAKADMKWGSSSTDILKPFDMGLNTGVGVTYKNVQLSLIYQFGLANISNFSNLEGMDLQEPANIGSHNSVLSMSLSYFIEL